MCNPNLEIKFCSCEISKSREVIINPETEKEAYLQKQFIWTLKRYIGEKYTGMLGQMLMPAEKLNEEITANYLLLQLNCKDLFDFDYTPAEGDNLEVQEDYIHPKVKGFSRPELYEYMSFIFRKGVWVEDVYDVFSDKTRRFKKGILEIQRRS